MKNSLNLEDFDLFKHHQRGIFKSKDPLPFKYSSPKKQTASISMIRNNPHPIEALVKVASYIKRPIELKRSFIYIRQGSAGLEQPTEVFDEENTPLLPSEMTSKLQDFPFNNSHKNARNAVHLIVSFPPKLNITKEQMTKFMASYMNAFAEQGYQFVYAVHSHQNAMHGHILLSLDHFGQHIRLDKKQLFQLRQHQVEIAKQFGWKLQATRFKDRDFSMSQIVIHTKKKTLLERQVPIWYAKYKQQKINPLHNRNAFSLLTEINNEALSNWSQQFNHPQIAQIKFLDMYAENSKNAFWYANHLPKVFDELKETSQQNLLTLNSSNFSMTLQQCLFICPNRQLSKQKTKLELEKC